MDSLVPESPDYCNQDQKTLADEETEHHGSDDTSSNSSFKSLGAAEEEEALAKEQYHDAQTPVEDDDVEEDDRPDPRWDRWRSSGSYRWSQRWDESKKKEEGNGFSLYQSDGGEVDSSMVGAGLWNLGNTCFLNAILQCFTHTVPLIQALRSYDHPKPCKRDSEGFCVLCSLHNHIELAIIKKGQSLSPFRIVENLNQLSSGFQRYQQEDAHELLQCLLDKLDICSKNSETDDNDESLVHRLFGGRLVSKLKCCNCGHGSDTFESLIDLSLEIENASSLLGALESFTKVEKIEDEEPQFTCESCKEKVTVEKQLMVDHAPLVAAFHLKRFKNDGSRIEKIDTHVEFPLELDLNPYTNRVHDENVDLNYMLYAIVVHSGFLPTSGHYYSFVRTAPDAWYRLDDSQVTRVSESHVLSRDAYILLYAKNGTPWFSTFMENEKPVIDSNTFSTSPKSVLENAKQTSESSPIMESNIISEVSEEDRKEAETSSGLHFNNSITKDEIGVTKVELKIDKKVFQSVFGVANSVISTTSPKPVVDKTDNMSVSFPIVEINISDVNEEDREDAMEISRLCFKDSSHKNRENEDKIESKMETSLSSPAGGDDNSNQNKRIFIKSNDFSSLTSRKSFSSIRNSKLSLDDFDLEDNVDVDKDEPKVDEKLSPSARKGGAEKGTDVNPSSTVSGLPCKIQSSDARERKLACKVARNMSGSKRRSQLLAVMNNNPEACLNNKKTKINKPSSSMKDQPSNGINNPNFVSLRRTVAPGRFR